MCVCGDFDVYGAVLSGCFGSKFAEFNVIKFDDKVYCCIHKL